MNWWTKQGFSFLPCHYSLKHHLRKYTQLNYSLYFSRPAQQGGLSGCSHSKHCFLLILAVLIFLLGTVMIHAEAASPATSVPHAEAPSPTTSVIHKEASWRNFKPWLEQANVTGDWGELRTKLLKKGIEFGFSSVNEVWGNTVGGLKTGAVATGVIQLATAVDFEKLMDWKGGSFYSRWLCLTGEDPSATMLGNLLGVSSIAGYDTFRNAELWMQQKFLGDQVSLRAGQLTLDSEFVISDYGSLFVNDSFGWSAFIYTSIPNGAPAYPMGAPGVRLKLEPTEKISFKMAVCQNTVYPQNVNNHGFDWNFNANKGLFYINEATYRYDMGLPGQVKAGAWFDSGTFPNLASSTASFLGNDGFYAIMDQMIYRPTDPQNTIKKIGDQGLGIFESVAFEPGDRNFFNFYCESGFNYKGLLPTRSQDSCGLAIAYGNASNATISQQQSQYAVSGNTLPGATGMTGLSFEMVLEATYQAQITPWLSIQPDLQYIIHPGAAQNLSNAFVIGLRASVTF